jgi:hypothetical protein
MLHLPLFEKRVRSARKQKKNGKFLIKLSSMGEEGKPHFVDEFACCTTCLLWSSFLMLFVFFCVALCVPLSHISTHISYRNIFIPNDRVLSIKLKCYKVQNALVSSFTHSLYSQLHRAIVCYIVYTLPDCCYTATMYVLICTIDLQQ